MSATFGLLLCSLAAPDVLAQKGLTSKARARSDADDAAESEARKAQEEREERAPTVVKEKEREKVIVQDAPKLKVEDFRKAMEFQVAEKRQELIDYLDQILDQNVAEEERPELLFQKAELFQEESQYRFFVGMGLDDDIGAAEDTGNKSKAKRLEAQKKDELKSSKDWLRDAVLILQEIDENYPEFERIPEVLYSLAQAFWSAGSYKKALKVYRKIIMKFPKSQHMADAWLAFGEFYFELGEEDERDLNKALDSYKKAAAIEESKVFGYAVYKQGWCYYNLQDFPNSAEKFKEVVFYSDLNADLLGAKRITLAREARKDFILAFAQFGKARTAVEEFKSIAPEFKDQKPMLERLANIWYGDGKDRDSIIIFRALMKMDPENTRNPLYQGKIVKLASRIGKKRQVVAQTRKLVEEYKRVREVHKKLKPGTPEHERVTEDLDAADEVSDNTLRYLATTWHNEAKKTRDNSTFQYALELYSDYLGLFPDRKTSYEIRFFYAELLFRLEKFELAGEQYGEVFQKDPKGKWASPAAEEAVRAYDEVIQDYNREHPLKAVAGPDALKPIPLPDIKKKYIGACNVYAKNFPKGEIVLEANYKVARTLYEHNYFNNSTPRFMEIIKKHSKSLRAEQSANLVLDTYNIIEDWEKLHDVARQFSRNRVLTKKPEFKEMLNKVLEQSSFKLISTYEDKKQWVEAASHYLAFAEEFHKSRLADKALANAAAMFSRAGQLDRAIKVRIKLVREHKDSPLVPDQVFSIASSYEQVVSYRQAATWLEKFSTDFPKDKRAKDALFNASIYRQGVGQTKTAIEDRELYLSRYPRAKEVVDIAFSIPVAWEQAGKKKKAKDAYLLFAKQWWKRQPARALNAEYKAVRMLQANSKWNKEFVRVYEDLKLMARDYRRRNRSQKKLLLVREPLGYLAFRNAQVVAQGFRAMKIAAPDNIKMFQKTFVEKKKAKDKVDKAFTSVVKLGSAEFAVASLYQIGKANKNLASAIQKVPPPKGLTEEQEMLFSDKLAEQTFPIEDQAAGAMELCLAKSAEFQVFNEWTRRCLSYLEEVRSEQFPKNELEEFPRIVVDDSRPQHGRGLVKTVPPKGKRAETLPGTEPPVPPPVEQRKKATSKPKEKSKARSKVKTDEPEDDDMSFDDSELDMGGES
ncbi:MAG: tetratricopeptide repeat protein [Deltaproteobacteria bacterium]|nr:tetratricopeptide repeat protein [Deltaproteobacteria bacterium]